MNDVISIETFRTPHDHRAAVADWRATAPAHDSKIFPAPRQIKSNGPMAGGLLRWLNRPAGIGEDGKPGRSLGGTNWRVDPSNDNKPDLEGFGMEKRQDIYPTFGEIGRAIESDDIERNADGAIIRMGRIRFSDGKNYERCDMLVEGGKVVIGLKRMPKGAMLGGKVKADQSPGGVTDPIGSNGYFADVLEAKPHRYITGKRGRRKACDFPNPPLPPTDMPFNEARAFCGLPAVERDMRVALPCGSPRVAESFLGMRKTTCSGGGSEAGWEDLCTMMIEKEQWLGASKEISAQDKAVFRAAGKAKNYGDIGASLGLHGDSARKAGALALSAANENLAASLKKLAA